MSDQIEAFWTQCRNAVPGIPEHASYTVKTFGNTEELADRLLTLIKAGEKTGTFALEWEFEQTPERIPRAGDHVIVLDGRGEPGCVYRIDTTEELPFRQITAQHVACEGPTMRELEAWRKMHWAYWTRILEGTGHSPTQDMPVIVQHFTVLYTDASASG